MTSCHTDHLFIWSHNGALQSLDRSIHRTTKDILYGETIPWSNPLRKDISQYSPTGKFTAPFFQIASSWPSPPPWKAPQKYTPTSFTMIFHPSLEWLEEPVSRQQRADHNWSTSAAPELQERQLLRNKQLRGKVQGQVRMKEFNENERKHKDIFQ